MQGIFQKENTDKALKYGIYRHLPTYEKIIRNLVSFLIKNNKEKYNNELFEFINKNEIDIVFVFGRAVYNNLPSCSKNKTAAEKQPDLDNGNLFVGKKRDFIRHCVYLKGEQHKNAKTMLKRDVHVYGLRHPSARCGFNAENYKPYLKNLI